MPLITTQLLDTGTARLELKACGKSACTVLLLPSLGRSADDFDALMRALAAAGWRALALNPRGIGASTGPLQNITLHDLAGDAAAVIAACAGGTAHVIGHAFGHRIACCLAVDQPQRVRKLVLVGAGGRIDSDPEARAAFKDFLTAALTPQQRRAAMHTANFAPTSDPAPWLEGWWPQTALAQIEAARATPHEQWWESGTAEVLVVQGLQDRMAPPENGRALRRALGARVRLVEIAQAGHALLPEQPAQVAAAVIEFLGRRERGVEARDRT